MIASPFDLTGTVALVTGANTGIGQGIACALAAAGADIVAAGRTPPDETGRRVAACGRRFLPLPADLSDPSAAGALVDAAVAGLGPLDILVNNAGTIRRVAALNFCEEDWDAVMDVNLKSAFFLAQAFARHALAAGRRGRIINVASLLSFQGGIRVASYTAAKSGLAGLTRLLANEWAPLGINVNAIAPGYIDTATTAPLRADPVRDGAILERIPAGRWGVPADIGGAAVFLASAAADYVHGTILPVDGGWLAR